MDPQLLAQFSELLKALKEIANKLPTGVPTPTSNTTNPLVISGTDAAVESAKAGIWGKTIGIGKFFPSNKAGTFIPPLIASLKSLFSDIFLQQLPNKLALALKDVIGGGISGSFNLGGRFVGAFNDIRLPAVGDAILSLSKSLAIAALGFAIFSQVSWMGVLYGVAALSGILVVLVRYNEQISKIKPVADELIKIGTALGFISLSFLAFSLASWDAVGIAALALGSILLAIGVFGEYAPRVKKVADEVLTIGIALGFISLSFLAFSLTPWSAVGIAVATLGSILLAIGLFGEYAPRVKKVGDEILAIGQALGYISLSFIAFSLTPWYTIFVPVITLGAILTMLAFYSEKVKKGKDVISGIVDIGKALGLVALSFIAFSFVTGSGFAAGIVALGALVGAAALLSNNRANIESGAELLQKLGIAFLLSSVGFLIFNFVDPESFTMGLVAIGALVAGVVAISLVKTQAIVGAGLLLALSASFLIFSVGASYLKGVDWEVLATAVLGIGALALFAGIMGGSAPLILIGAGLIVVLGGVLALFALTLQSLAGMESAGLPELGKNIGEFLSNLSSGISLGTLALPLVAAGLALVGPGIAMLIGVVKPFLGLNIGVLPEIGTNIGKFLTNLNENITVSTLGFLPAITLSLLGLGSALTEFGKFIPLLVTLPTGGLANFGEVMGKFLTSLTQNIDLTTLNRTRVLIPLLTDISPVLTKLSESVQRFSQLETSLLPLKAKDIGDFFKNLDIDTGFFGDADDKLEALKEFGVVLGGLKSPDQSFSEFINSFSSLGDVKINVDVLSTETRKTNEILQTSVSIQNQQLNELKQQTTLLSKLQISAPSQGSNLPQPNPTGVNSIKGTREQYNSSSYFIKSQ